MLTDTIGMSVSSVASSVEAQIGMAVLVKAQNVAKTQGDAAVSLLQQAADLANQLAKEGSVGTRLNVVA